MNTTTTATQDVAYVATLNGRTVYAGTDAHRATRAIASVQGARNDATPHGIVAAWLEGHEVASAHVYGIHHDDTATQRAETLERARLTADALAADLALWDPARERGEDAANARHVAAVAAHVAAEVRAPMAGVTTASSAVDRDVALVLDVLADADPEDSASIARAVAHAMPGYGVRARVNVAAATHAALAAILAHDERVYDAAA